MKDMYRKLAMLIGGSLLGLLILASPIRAADEKEATRESVGKGLAERFVKPADGIFGLIFNQKGEMVVVGRDGKIAEPCRLPTAKGEKPQDTKSKSGLQLCHGTSDTAVLKVTPLSVIEYTGSRCWLIPMTHAGVTEYFSYCIP